METNVIDAEVQTEESTSNDIQRGYESIANPEKAHEEVVELQTVEAPPESPEIIELRSQVAKIPDVLKQLRDVNGRYGSLSQQFEQLQTRLANPAVTQREANETAIDVEDLLADVKQAFGDEELYQGLKSAFSRLPLGNSLDPEQIGNMVKEQMEAARKSEIDTSLTQIVEKHPDFYEARTSVEFETWKATLSPRERSLLSRSEDPEYVIEMLDDFKDWHKAERAKAEAAKATNEEKPRTPQNSKSRLAAAVLPTDGAKPQHKSEPSANEAIMAGYNKVAGKRLR